VQPEIEIGPLTLQSFGLALAAAFACSGFLVIKRLKELGKPADWGYELLFGAIVGGIAGAKLWYVVEHGIDSFGDLFSGTGLVFYGGLAGGAAGVYLAGWRRGFTGLALLDACAPAVAIGYAVGRIGCQLAGDGDYGIPSDLPWAMAYPNGTVPTTEEVHPTPVYETLTMLGVTAYLWHMRNRMPPGGVFALYLFLAGLERFLVEFVRRNEEVALGLSLAQFIAFAMFVTGGVWLLKLRGREPAPPPSAPPPRKAPPPPPRRRARA
jgi:phosphatidylglycerol:prolipoprotein diacylglycerol transferase